jgi:hypothetical protein
MGRKGGREQSGFGLLVWIMFAAAAARRCSWAVSQLVEVIVDAVCFPALLLPLIDCSAALGQPASLGNARCR